ncbi:RNA binding domain-containing protein painting of fourth isoform X1 [Ptiloglossa arizonensis]|uniref:RNA binding domain-containing protein painting of fourth isoform X1 n=1 Tax=Ptiloglossa arizonensis TaxID=3350558 RepID=UPI003F9F27EC
MKRSVTEENGETKRSFVKQECVSFGYEGSYPTYTTSSSSPSTVTQPLPGQPPLPPMPPPTSGVPPPPHIFGPVPSQVTPIQAWTHPSAPWQWITPQTSPLPPPPPRDMTTNSFQREMPLRGNYMRRERFSHNRNNIYIQRSNFHRKNRRLARFGQSQGQFEQAAYFGATLSNSLGLEWQRNNYTTSTSDAILNHMPVPLPNHALPPIPPGILTNRHSEETSDQDVKIVLEEVVVKKNKQRKPMSQSYPSRPWNREDAERALKIENEYNKTVKAQSLIIKFPDPDLNKDIVREFHPGIQNIHFQSPSGPRYCFIQMAESVDIDEAIKELEKIPFGVGHLKVERKSLRDEDNPMPEEIDPYTLYIGNLPESVNVNEVKSKFPTAARVDVGYAQKMRNTRYAFIRYNSVDESISAYKQAHDLMWDTRSIIVRFRRQRGNTCLPGEPKPNVKKVKEEPNSNSQVKKEQKVNHADKNSSKLEINIESRRLQDNSNKTQSKISQIQEKSTNLQSSSSSVPTSIASAKSAQLQQQQPWTGQPPQIPSASEAPPPCSTERESVAETIMLTEIKEEPEDYEEIDVSSNIRSDEDIDDDDDDDDEEEEEDDESDDNDDDNENDYEDEDDEEEEDMDENGRLSFNDKQKEITKDNEPSDHLDQMFSELENMAGDIGF